MNKINKTSPRNARLSVLLLVALFSHFWAYGQSNANSPLGINLGGISSWNPGYVFVDVFKCSRPWISQEQGQPWGQGPALNLDANGWVISLQTNCWVDTVMVDGTDKPAGEYVVLYDGEGTMDFSGDVQTITPDGPGRILLDVTTGTGGIWLIITDTDPSSTGDYIRNIRVIMPGYEATYLTDPFYPVFLNRWEKFKVVRFMDWLATNNSTIQTWSNRTTLDSQTQMENGVALEYVIQLANTFQADAWICIPHQADDTYVTNFANMMVSNLDPGLKVYVEYSNECWNSQFDQYDYCSAEGLLLWPAELPWEAGGRYYSQRSVEIFDIFETAFGGTDRLVRVMAWQSGNIWWQDLILDWNNGYLKTDAFAVAPYFGGYLGSAATQDTISQWTVDQLLDACEAQIQTIMSTMQMQSANVGSRFNGEGENIVLITYEAGQHLVGTGGAENNVDLMNLFHAANRDARMKDVYLDYLMRWRETGGQLMAIFSSMYSPGKWGSWGLLESYSQAPMSVPKYAAVMQFNDSNQLPWWQTTPTPPPLGPALVDFQGSAVPANTLNRTWEDVSTTGKRFPFSMTDGDNIFNCLGYDQAEFYGGLLFDWDPNPKDYTGSSVNLYTSDRFYTSISGGVGIPTKIAALFMWRKDQFLDPMDPATVGKFIFNLTETEGNTKLRFVVRNGSTYYISDFVASSIGYYELAEFNNSSLPGHLWQVWTPTATNFEAPSPVLNAVPMVFDDVTEVGVAYVSTRSDYRTAFGFGTFTAYARSDEEFTVTLNEAAGQNDPTATSPINYTVVFSHPTSDFTTGDVTLHGATGADSAVVMEIVPMDGTTYNVEVTGMTLSGSVWTTVDAGVATNSSSYPNLASTSYNHVVQFNVAAPPTATINQAAGQSDPTGNSPVNFTAVFNELVTGFADGDVALSGTAGATTSVITEIAPLDGTTYEVAVSGMTADGTVIADIPAGVALNSLGAGNLASTSTDNTVTYDTSNPPTVTIDQAATQDDPTSNSPINFAAVFNQVVSGFETGDVTIGGTAGATTAVVTETDPFDDTTYNVAVSGMTVDGTVTASIAAGVCVSVSQGTPNWPPTSTDNEVTYTVSSPVGGTLIDFQGVNVPARNPSLNRSFVVSGDGMSESISFSTADGGNIFTSPDSQAVWYGGAKRDASPNPIGSGGYGFQLRTNDSDFAPNQFVAWIDEGAGGPSRHDYLFMWRQDQFLNGMDAATVGFDNDPANSKLSFNKLGSDNPCELRFVIRNGSTYYLSEFYDDNGAGHLIELTEFNNSSLAGKRWGVFTPTADDFDIPSPLPSFGAVDFTDLTEVGFVFYSSRSEYNNSVSLDAFTVDAITIQPPPSLQFNQASYSVDEGSGVVLATILVTRSGDDTGAISVDYATSDDTAFNGVDYTATNGTFNWGAGDKDPKSFTVDILSDPAAESDKSLNLTLSNPQGGAFLGTPSTVSLTIVDWIGPSVLVNHKWDQVTIRLSF